MGLYEAGIPLAGIHGGEEESLFNFERESSLGKISQLLNLPVNYDSCGHQLPN